MKSRRESFPKVAVDMFMVQGIWTLFFLGFIVVSQIIQNVISINMGNSNASFFIASHVSSRIYMLVIGIIGAYYFLPYYVQNGVTRKDYFKGAALGALMLAIALTVVALLIAGLEYLVIHSMNIPLTLEFSSAFDLEVEELFVANIMQAIIVPTPLEASTLSAIGMILSILGKYLYYVIGWMIGSAFYRYHVLVGLGSILLSIVFGIIHSAFWGMPMEGLLPFESQIISLSIPLAASLIGSVFIISFILWCIRQFTNRVPIKP